MTAITVLVKTSFIHADMNVRWLWSRWGHNNYWWRRFMMNNRWWRSLGGLQLSWSFLHDRPGLLYRLSVHCLNGRWCWRSHHIGFWTITWSTGL